MQPWELDEPRRQLKIEMDAYERFLERGGKPTSENGRLRRARIRKLGKAVLKNKVKEV